MNGEFTRTQIRLATSGDASALSGLLAELGFPSSAQDVSKRLEAMKSMAFVAVEEGAVIGLVTINIMPVLHRRTAVGRLSALVVSKERRGRGVGRALVAAAEKAVKSQGCELIEVTSNFRLEEAHVFYKRIGYEATSFRFKKDL